MFRRKSLSTRKLNKKKDKHLSKAKSTLYLFQVLVMSFALIYNLDIIEPNDIITYLAILGIVVVSGLVLELVTKTDTTLLLIVNMLYTIGVSIIYRLDPATGKKQLIFYLIGLVTFFLTMLILKLVNNWENYTLFYFVVAVVLFLVTLIFGQAIGGAKNWIVIGGVTIQPSEFIKIPYLFFVASFYTRYGELEKKKYGRYYMTIGIYIFIALFFLQRELGTAIIFFAVMILSQFIYEKDYKLITINTILMVFGLVFAYLTMGYIRDRFHIWHDPWADAENKGFQIIQSLIAIASGGLFGKGIGMGRPDFIPVAESDFIFPAVVEEMGIFTGIGVVLLFLLLVYKALQIGFNQEDKFFSILAFTTGAMLGIQTILIVCGSLKIIPLTGVTLPFISAGGSSMISGFIMLACLQYASQKFKIKGVTHEETTHNTK